MPDFRPTRRTESSQESRRLLVDAATDLFAEHGFRQTTFEHIAARSRVSRGSIPWHFGNKEGLLSAVVEQAMSDLRGRASHLEAGQLEATISALVEFTRSRSAKLFLTLLAEANEPGSPLRSWYADLHQGMRAQARAWFAIPGAAEEADVDALSTVIVGAIMGIHQQWRIAPDAIDLEATYAELGRLVQRVSDRNPRTSA